MKFELHKFFIKTSVAIVRLQRSFTSAILTLYSIRIYFKLPVRMLMELRNEELDTHEGVLQNQVRTAARGLSQISTVTGRASGQVNVSVAA